MKRSYTEMQVLKKLDIPDFRHLSKDKVIAFASMLHRMHPEVAKKALEQFPDFASTSLSIMTDYKGIIEKALEDDAKGAQICYDMYESIMNALRNALHDDLPFEEQKYILEQMYVVAQETTKLTHERANYRLKVLGMASGVALGVVAILGSVLGSNFAIKRDNLDEDLDDEKILK